MKKVILVVLLMPYLASAQVVDNFESGDLKNWIQNIPERWNADTLEALSGNFSLHHAFDNTEAGSDRIGIKINNLHPGEGKTSWSFTVRHGYEPSSSNNWMVFLLTESGPEKMSATECSAAFAIGVNITGSDDSLRLVKIADGNISTIVNCGINWQTEIGIANPVKINAERNETGQWKVEVLKVTNELVRASSGTDMSLCSPGWFGISYKYSATKDRLFWIDDIKIDGIFYADTLPPQLPVNAKTGDLVISEIMADPVPSVSLPEEEFIEITNKTDFSFNLKGWKLLSSEGIYSFPEKILVPHGIMILCHVSDTLSFRKYGATCGFTSFPVLNDQGKMICILNSTGTLIHGVEYSDSWYGDLLKSEGGWSLEMIDTAYPFFHGGNWTASSSRSGGTPGAANATAGKNPDISFEGLLNVYPADSLHLTVMFSEPVLDYSGIPEDANIKGPDIKEIIPADPLLRSFDLILSEPLARQIAYELELPDDLCDFAGNGIQRKKYSFGIPGQVLKGDILFNEILFDPLPGGSDFIEFYNASDKIIDASRLFLVSINDDSDTSGLTRVSDVPRCIMPSAYYSISEGENEVENTFPDGEGEFIFYAGELPSMPDDKGHLILFNRELDIIDEVYYNEKMHSSLLSGTEGISLEKTNPIISSLEAVNWHSAAESSGWGTPGKVNSIFNELPANDEQVNFSSKRITPDADGYEDILGIGLKLPGIGNVVSVSVFDEAGSFIKNIATNLLTGPESTLLWDGTAADGSPVRSGIYIILITYFNESGQRGSWKKVCTVIRN